MLRQWRHMAVGATGQPLYCHPQQFPGGCGIGKSCFDLQDASTIQMQELYVYL